MQTLKILSLFSGCGGLDLGFLLANRDLTQYKYEIVWANDIEQAACDTYRKNIGHHIYCGDIQAVDFKDTPDCDIILGGFPCQDFSVLWKRGGIETARGNLYLDFIKAIEVKRPLLFVAENVKGLLSANKGKAIEKITHDFAEKGYNFSCYLYNAADFGVPQLRERVIMVGVRKDAVYSMEYQAGIHGELTPIFFPKLNPSHSGTHVTSQEALKGVQDVPYNNERLNIKKRTEQIIAAIPPGGNFTDIPADSDLYVKGMISHVYRRLHPDKPSTTVIAGGGGGTWGYHYDEPRPLTNRERARLQSFPDDFVFEGSIAEVRKQIGNAVPPGLSKVLAVSIEKFLGEIVFAGVTETQETEQQLFLPV